MLVFKSVSAGSWSRAAGWIGAACFAFFAGGEARAQAPAEPSAAPAEPPPPAPVEPPPAKEAPAAAEGISWLDPARFGGTTFDWSHHATARLLGIGDRYVNDNETYWMVFALSLNYWPVWEPRHKLGVGTGVAVRVKVIDDGDPTVKDKGVPYVADIPLSLRYAATLYASSKGRITSGPAAMRDPTLLGEGDWRTWALVSGGLSFPVSNESKAAGQVLATSLGVGARQQIKLLGTEAPALRYMLVTGSFGWGHAFISTPDLLPFAPSRSADTNALSYTFDLLFALYTGLELRTTFGYTQAFREVIESSGCEVIVSGECVDVPTQDPPATLDSTLWSAQLAYEIIPELAVSIGYTNAGPTIDESGQSPSIFYSPNAVFSLGVTFSIDRLYQRAAGTPERLREL